MRKTRQFVVLFLPIVLATAALAQEKEAQSPPATTQPQAQTQAATPILDVIPAEAWGAICVPNVEELDKEVSDLLQRLNFGGVSPLSMLKAMVPDLSEIDDSGSLAIVFMPVADFDNMDEGVVTLLPGLDIDTLKEAPSATGGASDDGKEAGAAKDAPGGIKKVDIKGEISYAARKSGYAILSESREALRKFMEGKPGVRDILGPNRVSRFKKDHFSIYANGEALLRSQAMKPVLEQIESMSGMMPGLGSSMTMLKDMRLVHISMNLSKAGLDVNVYVDAQKGTDLAKMLNASSDQSGTFWIGLPDEKCILASGGVVSESLAKIVAQQWGTMMNIPQAKDLIGAEAYERLMKKLTPLIEDWRGFALSVSALPEGDKGMVGVACIFTVADSNRWMETCSKIIEDLQSSVTPENEAEMGWVRLLNHKRGAEKIADASVDQLTVDMQAMIGDDAEKAAVVKKVLGDEGLVLRGAAAGSKHVVFSLSGGLDRMTKIVGLVKEEKAPLADNPGFKKNMENLPNKRMSETHLALDQLVKTINGVAQATGQQGIPVNMPPINAPLTIVKSKDGDGEQTDLYMPMDLIMAVKDVVMTMMGQMMGGGAEPQEQ